MDNLSDLVHRIKKVSHFSKLSLTDLQMIICAGTQKQIPAGSTVFREGEPCSGMYVLLRGKVRLFQFGPMGQVNIISVIHPVIMFNEVAVLDGGPNPVTAITVEDSLLWHVGHDAFQDLLLKIPQVGTGLLKTLASRNRELMSYCEDLSFRSVVSRTAKLLLNISKNGEVPINRKVFSVEEMACRIATVPEAFCRSLNILKSRELINVCRREIMITDQDGLADLAQLTNDKKEQAQ